jgi:hypothetical protein
MMTTRGPPEADADFFLDFFFALFFFALFFFVLFFFVLFFFVLFFFVLFFFVLFLAMDPPEVAAEDYRTTTGPEARYSA